jgi:hypothetical protein
MRIFFATNSLPAENNLPAWANGTKTWPQIVILAISSVSLAICVVVFYGYWRGGHRRAEKVGVYYTIFAVGFFMFSVVMWGMAAGILQSAKDNSSNQDIWGWSCVDNKRRQLFADKVDYALVCRLQVRIYSPNSFHFWLTLYTVLVFDMLRHRSCRRNDDYPDLWNRLLPLLF